MLLKADPGAAHQAVPGAFWIVVGSSFGYTGSCTVGAANYARYLRPDQARPAGWYAAIGNVTSSTVLQIAGVAAVTAVGVGNWNGDDPAASYASPLPGWLGHLTSPHPDRHLHRRAVRELGQPLLELAVVRDHGRPAADAFARAAIAVAIGVVSPSVALAVLHDSSSLGNFLLVTAYWTGPWLGVVLADRLLVRTWPALPRPGRPHL